MFLVFKIIFTFQLAQASIGANASNVACTAAMSAAETACRNPLAADCAPKAGACASKCTEAALGKAGLFSEARCTLPAGQTCSDISQMSGSWIPRISKCSEWAGGTGDPTDPDETPITPRNAADAQKQCRAWGPKVDTAKKVAAIPDDQLSSCVEVCAAAAEGASETVKAEMKKINDKCYSGLPSEGDTTTSVASEPPADDSTDAGDGDDSGTVNGGDDVTGNTSGTNGTNSFSGLNSGGNPPTVGSQVSMVNWATGPEANQGLFEKAASDASAAAAGLGFSPPSTLPHDMDRAYVSSVGKKPDTNGGGSGSGGGAGMQPSPFMGGQMPSGSNGGGSASRSGARGGGGSAGGGQVAGGQVGKVGQNAYYSGGGSMSPAANKVAAAAKVRKSAFNPHYSPKTDDGGTALLRMFGKNARNEYNRRRQNNFNYAEYGKSCLNTVFCGIETRFQDLLKDYDTGPVENITADTSEAKEVRGTASQKRKGK